MMVSEWQLDVPKIRPNLRAHFMGSADGIS